jgi:hypothetical protein
MKSIKAMAVVLVVSREPGAANNTTAGDNEKSIQEARE